MSIAHCVDEFGRQYHFDKQLGSKGEGAVYALKGDGEHVVKIYHDPPTQEKIEKLRHQAELNNLGLTGLTAWPEKLMFDAKSRKPIGFLMPRVKESKPIQLLYNPVKRLEEFPRADFAFQLRVADNLAAAVEEVHNAHCVIGDINEDFAWVSAQALVRLLDCDSFQVVRNGQRYACEVGTDRYTPPELQGQSFRGVVRTVNHDAFGMAVLIFQLLFVGRHPYAGIFQGHGEPSFQDHIQQFRFAHGPRAASWGMKPPPHTPVLTDLPPDVGALFQRAFERGSERGTRPAPREWLPGIK